MRKVALVGFMGAGKSAVGPAVAAALGVPFTDLDAELERRFGAIAGQFATEGEATFRAREVDAVSAWLAAPGSGVVALGGGAFHQPAIVEALWGRAVTVFLDAPWEVLSQRVAQAGNRPLWDDRVEQRFRARLPGYRTADHRVDAAGPPDAVAARVVAALDPYESPRAHSVPVALSTSPYEVHVGRGFSGLGASVKACCPAGAEGVVLVTDDTVAPLWSAAVERELVVARGVVLSAGEAHKGWPSLQAVLDGILGGPVHRGTVVVALGGGVVGDVAGLGAALAMRGVPVVQLPTTLLAMVDSSVGGKTAINHAKGKNLVGAFHQPSLVWAASSTLATLAPEERRAGWGEVAKTALIGDPTLLERLPEAEQQARDGVWDGVEDVVARCVAVKAAVVAQDATERGVRVWLNAGHTVAHGLETALGHGVIPHGRAVALGLLAELRWAVAEGISEEPGLVGRLEAALRGAGVDLSVPSHDRERALRAMGLDKKGTADAVRIPVPKRGGEMVVVDLARERLGELLRWA